ncbi:MAG: BrxA/BrxB family bacilliredoxin [Ignavibacteriales bacterium]|nr:BrxA/BrxB family bacilliredoxin [Ignavibacteriales bacterium]
MITNDDLRAEIRKMGLKELRTTVEVEQTFNNHRGTMLVYINSACGCASGVAVPALEIAMKHNKLPNYFTTIFATTDREATAKARSYFATEPPSSPSFAILKDGKFAGIIHRSSIQHNTPENVARMLQEMFDKNCK